MMETPLPCPCNKPSPPMSMPRLSALLPSLFVSCLLGLAVSCVPLSPPSSAVVKPSPPPVVEVAAGPYWHSLGSDGPTAREALAYYAALKTLRNEELDREHKRLRGEIAGSAEGGGLSALQLVLLAVVPGQTVIPPDQSIKLLETARQDAALHRQLADLFILLGDQLASRLTVQAQSKQGSQTLRSTRKKLTSQGDDLANCRRERDDLADKLEQLQSIERDLMNREGKAP